MGWSSKHSHLRPYCRGLVVPKMTHPTCDMVKAWDSWFMVIRPRMGIVMMGLDYIPLYIPLYIPDWLIWIDDEPPFNGLIQSIFLIMAHTWLLSSPPRSSASSSEGGTAPSARNMLQSFESGTAPSAKNMLSSFEKISKNGNDTLRTRDMAICYETAKTATETADKVRFIIHTWYIVIPLLKITMEISHS